MILELCCQRTKAWAVTVGIFILLIMTAFLGISSFRNHSYLSYDITEMIYHALVVKSGRIPYVDDVTHHFMGYVFPLMFLNSPDAVWCLSASYICITALLAFMLAKELGLPNVRVLLATVAVTIGWLYGWVGFIFELQSQALPLIWLLLVSLARAWRLQSSRMMAGAGFLLGIMAVMDQRLILYGSMMFLPLCHSSWLNRKRAVATAMVFVALVPSLAGLWLYAHGALWSCVQHALIFPLSMRNKGVPFSILEFLKKGVDAEPMAAALIGIGFLICLAVRAVPKPYRVIYLSVTVLGLIYSVLGGRYYIHYLLVLQPAVVLSTGLLACAISFRYLKGLLFALCGSYMLFPICVGIGAGRWTLPVDDLVMRNAAEVVRKNSDFGEEVLVWGPAPSIYLYSERRTSFPDMGLYSALGANYESNQLEDQGIDPQMSVLLKNYLTDTAPIIFVYYETMRDRNPEFIGPASNSYVGHPLGPPMKQMDFKHLPHLEYVKDLISNRYERVATFEGEFDRAEVYKLRPYVAPGIINGQTS